MGKSWKNPAKVANAAKKGIQISKVAKEIAVAAKLGGADPEGNPRLRLALTAARSISCPKDTIDRAIKKGSGQLDDGAMFEEVLYEGFGPHQVGVLVLCQTDNRNRTSPEMKTLFLKSGGRMGDPGSIAWMFERTGIIKATHTDVSLDLEMEALEADAGDVTEEDKNDTSLTATFYTDLPQLDALRQNLIKRGWEIEVFEPGYKPKSASPDLTEEQLQELGEFLSKLDDHDDTYRAYTQLD